MRVNDALIGAVLIVLGTAVYLYARTLPDIPGQQYGAAVFPSLVAAGLAGCGALLAFSGVRHWQGAVMPAEWMSSPAAWARVSATFGLLLFYIFFSDRLGFVLVSTIMMFALLLLLGSRWWVAALIAIVLTIVVARAFGSLLLVPLPRGLLWI